MGFPNGFEVEDPELVFADGFGDALGAKGLLVGDGTLEIGAEPAALPKADV